MVVEYAFEGINEYEHVFIVWKLLTWPSLKKIVKSNWKYLQISLKCGFSKDQKMNNRMNLMQISSKFSILRDQNDGHLDYPTVLFCLWTLHFLFVLIKLSSRKQRAWIVFDFPRIVLPLFVLPTRASLLEASSSACFPSQLIAACSGLLFIYVNFYFNHNHSNFLHNYYKSL